MDKKTVLAVVLSIAVLFVYQFFFIEKPVPPKVVPVQETKQASVDTAVEKPAPVQPVEVKKPALKKIAFQ
jgi:multidrug efflux pump subunit AcrA (membrane-fusion protein)